MPAYIYHLTQHARILSLITIHSKVPEKNGTCNVALSDHFQRRKKQSRIT